VLNRRQMFVKSGIGAATLLGLSAFEGTGVAQSLAMSGGSDGTIAPYSHLDQLPDDPEVLSAAAGIIELIREAPTTPGKTGKPRSGSYGGRMRILSKSLALFNAKRMNVCYGLDTMHDIPKLRLTIAGRINAVVRLLDARQLSYEQVVRAITHAMGLFSEEHRALWQ
jgi:hypothetical protein